MQFSTARLLYQSRFDATNLVGVRRRFLRHLHVAGLTDDRSGDFLIAVAEILANTIEHGGGTGTIELRQVGDRLDCDICDQGPGLPSGAHGTHLAAPFDERGRGLRLAHLLCDQVLHHRVSIGTRITLMIAVPPTPA